MIKINPIVKEILEWAVCIIVAVILALLVRYYIGTPTEVQHSSMYPTLKEGQRLILNRIARTTHATFERGDIVTFEAPSRTDIPNREANLQNPIAEYENEPQSWWGKFTYYVLEFNKTSYIKRVIGLPGEHVKIENGKVYINDKELKEPYLPKGVTTPQEGGYVDFIVPEGTLFLMGDNRENSMDCRKFGCIPIEKIEGKVWIRFWPLNLFGEV